MLSGFGNIYFYLLSFLRFIVQELAMVSTGLTAAILGMDFMLGQYFSVLTLSSVPFDLITIALCLFVLHESPKYAVEYFKFHFFLDIC